MKPFICKGKWPWCKSLRPEPTQWAHKTDHDTLNTIPALMSKTGCCQPSAPWPVRLVDVRIRLNVFSRMTQGSREQLALTKQNVTGTGSSQEGQHQVKNKREQIRMKIRRRVSLRFLCRTNLHPKKKNKIKNYIRREIKSNNTFWRVLWLSLKGSI